MLGLNAAQQLLFDITEESLKSHPQNWNFTQHTAENKKLGITIWMANRFYGTSIKGRGIACGDQQCSPAFLQPWRKRIVLLAESVAMQQIKDDFPLE